CTRSTMATTGAMDYW
nr:immunoglobulin heavy chain junction region [Mus musculus]